MDTGNLLADPLQGLLDAALHARAQQQVLRGIAAQRQFREDDEIAVQVIPGLAGCGDDPIHIAVDVADLEVHLRHHDVQQLTHALFLARLIGAFPACSEAGQSMPCRAHRLRQPC